YEADAANAGESAQAIQFCLQPGDQRLGHSNAPFRPEGADDQRIAVAIRLHVYSSNGSVSPQNRINIVAILSPGFRNEDLDAVEKAEQTLRARSITQQGVERAHDTNSVCRFWREQCRFHPS